MAQILCLALEPGWLWRGIGIRASLNDVGNAISELLSDLSEARLPALVFHSIMEQRGNRFILVAAVRQDDRRHSKEVSDIGAIGSLSELSGMQARRISKSTIKTLA